MLQLIEAIINNIDHFKICAISPVKETIMFMIFNALLMQCLANEQAGKMPKVFWLVH